MSLLLYGANGYTGSLILEKLDRFDMSPIIAGRNEDKVKPLAEKYNLRYSIFSLDDPQAIVAALEEIKVVLHVAGPFIHTAKPMMEACIQTGTHYLDITGEIQVFEAAADLDAAAKKAGVMLLSGVGFDVVPTDCMADYLHEKMPDAIKLELAFGYSDGGVSKGTATTLVEDLGEGSVARIDDRLVKEPMGDHVLKVPLMKDGQQQTVVNIPWGDVATAWYTTGISNIRTYIAMPSSSVKWIRMQKYISSILRSSFFKSIAKTIINSRPAGPDAKKRARSRSFVWGRVTNRTGKQITARWTGPEAYELTSLSSLYIASQVLKGKCQPGYQTPAGIFGYELALKQVFGDTSLTTLEE